MNKIIHRIQIKHKLILKKITFKIKSKIYYYKINYKANRKK